MPSPSPVHSPSTAVDLLTQLGDSQWHGSELLSRDTLIGHQTDLCCNSYALSWLVTLPLEIVAASITVSYWPGAKSVNGAARVTIFLVVIISINLFGVRGNGEAEFVFSIIKIVAVLGFM